MEQRQHCGRVVRGHILRHSWAESRVARDVAVGIRADLSQKEEALPAFSVQFIPKPTRFISMGDFSRGN